MVRGSLPHALRLNFICIVKARTPDTLTKFKYDSKDGEEKKYTAFDLIRSSRRFVET